MARRKKPQRRGRAKSVVRAAESKGPVSSGKRERSELLDPTLLGLWLLLFLPPLVFLPGLTDNFRLPKLLLTELLGILSLLLLSFRLWRLPGLDIKGFFRSPAFLVVAPILFVGSLGLAFGEHPEITRRALPSLWIGGACLLGWSVALREKERRLLLQAVIWPATFLAFFAVLQFHDLFDPFSFQGRVTDRTGLTSLAGGAFDLSGYLVLPLLLAQAAWPRASKRWRIVLGFFLIVGLWATIASRTVTALIALLVGSFVLWCRVVPRRRMLGVTALTGCLVLILISVGPLKERARKIGASLQKGEVNRLLTGRLDAWRGAMWMLEQHPILGVGHGAFRAEFGPARLELSERGVQFFRGQKQVFFTNAHSDVLNALAEWGLFGALGLLVAGYFFIKALRRRWRAMGVRGPPEAAPSSDQESSTHSEPDSDVEASVKPAAEETGREPVAVSSWIAIDSKYLDLAALVALFALSSTYFPFHLGLLTYPWLILLGGLMASPPREADAEPGPSRKPQRFLMAALIALLIWVGWVRFGQARHLLGASRLVAVAEASIMQMAEGGGVPEALLRRNLELLRRAGEMDPAEVGVPIAEGGHFFLLQRYDAALRAYQRAASLEMRSEVFANMARVHLNAGRRDEAIEAIERALTLDATQRRVFGEILREEKRRQRATGRRGDE